jgi:hypothetical protein
MSDATFLDAYISEDQLIEELIAKKIKPPSKRTLRSWRRRGVIPFVKLGKSQVLIPRDFNPADRKRRVR